MSLTPAQKAIKSATLALIAGESLSINDYSRLRDDFDERATPAAILALLAQLEAQPASLDQLNAMLRAEIDRLAPPAPPPDSTGGAKAAEDTAIIAKFEAAISEDPAAYSRPGECVYQITRKEVLAFVAAVQPVQAVPDAPLQVIREAVERYYKALSAREHAGAAQDRGWRSVEAALEMDWDSWRKAKLASPPEPPQ
ncbi:MAG: hypothetical protein JWQ01_4807 [Massilia sp.]|nr:hypothetical protein [Massilia sp.]